MSQPNFSQRTNQLSTTLRSEPAASLPQGSEETKTDLVQRHAAESCFGWWDAIIFCVFFRLFIVELKLHSVYVRLENIFHPYRIKSGKKHCWVAWRLICTTELVCYSMYLLQVYAHHIYRAYVWVCVCVAFVQFFVSIWSIWLLAWHNSIIVPNRYMQKVEQKFKRSSN